MTYATTEKLETPGWPAWSAPDFLVGQRGVYVFGFDEFVKIGYSTNIARRHRELEDGTPEDLIAYLFLPGANHGHESRLHKHFAAERRRGEWFRMSERMRTFLVERGWSQDSCAVAPEPDFGSIVPRGVSADDAAAFLRLSPARFRTLVAVGRLPAPTSLGAWDLLRLVA